jgi:hypothetical protein
MNNGHRTRGRWGGDFDLQLSLEKGWTIEGEYRNAHEKSVFVCPSGHRRVISWGALRLSFFCQTCRDEEIKREVQSFLSGTEWSVLGVSRGKVSIGCRNGHLYRPCRASYIRKKIEREPRCSECHKIEHGESYRSLMDEVGWVMLGNYEGSHVPLLCECSMGHRQMKVPSGFLSGKGCRKCSGLLKKTNDEVRLEFEKFGWNLVGRYINTSMPVECICPNGHLVKKSLDCLRIRPKGCVVCSGQVPVHPLKKRDRRNERVKNWRNWRPLILERDGCKCVICGSTNGVNAHHLNSYHKSVGERYSLDNGVTLCQRHHGGPFNRIAGSFHMVFGCMNNTKEQFEEYRKIVAEGKVKV